MNKIRILILEDDHTQANELAEIIDKAGYEVTGIAHNLVEALGLFYSQKPDMVISDIYIDGQRDGITFAERINENKNTTRPIIFLTQYADLETFKKAKLTSPYNYLLKPYNPLELQYAIELALEKFLGTSGTFSIGNDNALLLEQSLYVKTGHSLIKILLKEVYYIEVDGKYSKIIVDQGNFLVQMPLKKMEEKLSSLSFLRVHRNYLINSKRIKKIHLADHHVILTNDQEIPFSQTYKEQLIGIYDVLK